MSTRTYVLASTYRYGTLGRILVITRSTFIYGWILFWFVLILHIRGFLIFSMDQMLPIRGPKHFRRHVDGHFGSQCNALRAGQCNASRAGIALAPALPPTSWEGMRQYIFNLCERWAPFQAIIMPTDVYRSNFFAVKRIVFACEHFLLPFESICSWDAYAWQSMLPLQLFIFDTTTLCMLALMADDCRSSSYVLNVHLHPLTPFYLQSTSFFGWDQPLPCASQWAWLDHEDQTPWSFSILFSYIDILYR